MIATSASVQELAWRDAIRSVKGGASYLPRISRPVANRLLIAAGSRGEANLRPISLGYRDAGASALEALAVGLGKKLKTEPNDKLEPTLAVLAAAIGRSSGDVSYSAQYSPSEFVYRLPDRDLPPFLAEARAPFEPTFIMSRDTEMPTWFTTDKVIAGLLGLIATLISVVFLSVRSDIDDLKKVSLEMPKQISDLKVGLVSSIKDVEKQAAIANSRLDLILEELKRPQRR
jgi:hypothetical protein